MTREQEEQLLALQEKRIKVNNSTDPDVWEDLAAEYAAFGALSNAAACARRGLEYRKVRTEAQGETVLP